MWNNIVEKSMKHYTSDFLYNSKQTSSMDDVLLNYCIT